MAEKEQKQRIRIRLKAYDHKVIDQSAKQIVDTALRTGAKISGPIPLPTKRSTFTVIKSPHVYKKGGEAFRDACSQKRFIDISQPTPKTIDSSDESLSTCRLRRRNQNVAIDILHLLLN
jgi:small subunit ribosomal protein S10